MRDPTVQKFLEETTEDLPVSGKRRTGGQKAARELAGSSRVSKAGVEEATAWRDAEGPGDAAQSAAVRGPPRQGPPLAPATRGSHRRRRGARRRGRGRGTAGPGDAARSAAAAADTKPRAAPRSSLSSLQQQQQRLCQLALLLRQRPTRRMLQQRRRQAAAACSQAERAACFPKLQQVLFCCKCAYRDQEVSVYDNSYARHSLENVLHSCMYEIGRRNICSSCRTSSSLLCID